MMLLSPTRRPHRRILSSFLVLIATVIMAGCAEPHIPQGDASPPDTPLRETADVDPLDKALDDAVDLLITALDDINNLLATDATERDTLHTSGQTALELLVFANDAVFPSARPETERNATGNDRLTVVMNAARASGSHRGDMVMNALRDTLAGDLGSWERDPVGMRTTALSAYGATFETTKDAVATLPADGMRAVAWIAFAVNHDSPEVIKDAFITAQTHLEIVTFSVRAANAT
ncbi:MAG: hypothetical protein WD360_04365 [Nitriliruptoraceae bacterium]